MKKHHYQAIAEALQPLFDTGDQAMLDIIMEVMKVLKSENPRFDQIKFLDYLRGYK